MQFDTHGELEFKMDERTYRMIPLANSGDYLYKRNSLNAAKLVSYKLLNVKSIPLAGGLQLTHSLKK